MFLQRGVVYLVIWGTCGSWPCPENCKVTKNLDLPTCDSDKACFRGCKDGFFGVTCNVSCDDKCDRGACQQLGGSCNCLKGYTFSAGVCASHEGVECNFNEHCLKDRCITAGRKDCLEGCKPGWFGKFCEEKCFDHCNCERWSLKCASCEEGWFGKECQSPCSPGCRDKNCDRTGTCTNGCSPGSYGTTCDNNCSRHCVSECDQLLGECVQCEAGRYGSNCQSECSAGCAGTDKNCDRDGTCISGCRNGYFGETCESICPDHCYRGMCDLNGTCSACENGFFGAFCHQPCLSCTDGICDISTGECTKGCENDHYGSFCNLTCEDCDGGYCDWNTGECRDTGVQYWVWGGVAVVIMIIAAVLVYMSYRFKRMHGVMYDIVKWRPSNTAAQDTSPGVAPGYTDIDDEMAIILPTVCPISPKSQTGYLRPRHSGASSNNLQMELHVSGVSDLEVEAPQTAASPGNLQPLAKISQDVLRSSVEWSENYTIPNYCEINENLMSTLPQSAREARAPTPPLNKTSFSVKADVHVQTKSSDEIGAVGGEISIPLIAECFGNTENQDSPAEQEPRPDEVNYNHLFRDHYIP